MNYTHLSKKDLISEIEKLKSIAQSDMLEFQTKREKEIRKELDVANHQLKKLNHAIEQSMAIVVITDKQGQIEYVNPAFTKRSGYTFEEATGHKPGILKSGRHSDAFYKDLWDTILSGKTWKGDFVNKKKSGEEFWESASISPMFDKKGEITHFVAVKEDISERKILEAELINSKEQAEQANRAKSTFLANMSHEIRTPMNAILGYSEILSKLIKNPTQKDYLASIQSSGKTLLKLINNILDLSKIESGKLELSYEATNIEKIIHDVVGMFQVKVQEKGLEIITHIADNLPNFLHLDELSINQILINLINNAVKFTKTGSVFIEVRARNISSNELDLILKVKDTGLGIAKEHQQKIFQAFEQIEGQASRGYEGTGLGLTITKQLVKQMNGKIELKSEMGMGSTFTIILEKIKIDASKKGIEEYTEPPIDSIQFENPRILIVDDIKTNRDILKGYFSDYQISCIEATNGKEAITAMKEYLPHLVFLDLKMPIMDGYEANKIIQENKAWSHIPIVAITASVFDSEEQKIKDQGFSAYIRKPASSHDIMKLLKKYLKHTSDKNIINAKETNEETIERLEEVLVEIQEKAMPVWEEIKNLRINKKVIQLADLLIEIGENFRAKPITTYGKILLGANEAFNIEKEDQMIQQFPEFIDGLK
ncbi:MAG: PAS domain S-box protein [Bacteroidales bacterium]|nr:PAS domain S-box protein [Bacteroidales bacterium]